MWYLLPIAAFSLALLGHAATTRFWPAGNRVNQFIAIGLLAGILAVFPPETLCPTLAARLAGIAGYAFACELYIFLFTFVTSSVSVSLLLGTHPEPATGFSLEPAEMVRRRLQAMTEAGLLRREQDRLLPTARAQRIVACHRVLRRFFHGSGAT